MRIEFIVSRLCGARVHAVGDVIDVPDSVGKRLVNGKVAIKTDRAAGLMESPEAKATGQLETPETAGRKPGRPLGR